MKPGPSGGSAMPGVPESSGHSPAMRAQQASMLSTGPCRQMGRAVWACPSRRHTSLLAVWLGRPFPGCSTADLALVKAKRHQDALGSPGVGLCPSPIVEVTQRPLELCCGLLAPHTVCMLSTVQAPQGPVSMAKHYARPGRGEAAEEEWCWGGTRALVLTHPGCLEGLPTRQGPPLCSCSAAHVASCHSCVTW